MKTKPIKVLIVDDSPSVRQLLKHILTSDPRIRLTGMACNGREALQMIERERPDIITMDMDMPELNGEETTKRIMEKDPIPIIVITASLSAKDVRNSYRALTAGALAVISKPVGPGHADYSQIAGEILRNVIALQGVKLVRRKFKDLPGANGECGLRKVPDEAYQAGEPDIQHIAIGASTGGPGVIQYLLKQLPAQFSASIYLVQHISGGFLPGFVEWLKSTTGRQITIMEQGMKTHSGSIYIPPEGYEAAIAADLTAQLSRCNAGAFICPSIAHLFASLARNFGSGAAGILLTGMGKDGAAELKMMKDAGSITIAQDPESSVIYGMPGEAAKLGAADYILPPEMIAEFLNTILTRTKAKFGPRV